MSTHQEQANKIEKTLELKASVERVWRALTDHKEFGAWFRVNLEGPFEEGKEARGKITYPGYEHIEWKVMVKEIRKPELFSFTWHPYAVDTNVDYAKETPTLVEFRLEPKGTGTLLTLTESGFDKIPAGRVVEAFRRNDGGWTQQMINIQQHVDP